MSRIGMLADLNSAAARLRPPDRSIRNPDGRLAEMRIKIILTLVVIPPLIAFIVAGLVR